MRKTRLLLNGLLMSCLLGLTACAATSPCNRADVQQAYDAMGGERHDAVTLTNACMDRLLGDLKACLKASQ